MGSIVQFGIAGFWEGDIKDIQQEQLDILKDMVKLNAIIVTERIQVAVSTEKWNDTCELLRKHNLKH